MLAQPIRRQCFSIRRDNATFSPISVHAGEVSCRRAASALTATTLAPVAVDPMFTIWTVLAGTGRRCDRSDTYQNFVLGQFRDLGLFAIGRLHTKQSSKQEVVDFDLCVNVGEVTTEAQDESDQTISTAECRIDSCTDTCFLLDVIDR